jgi:Na+/proline symporter
VIEPGIQNRDHTFFVLMKDFLPRGALGFGLAAFVAVFTSTVNTTIMVVSATLTKDFYKGFLNRGASDRQLLRVGRITTLLSGVIALCVALAIPDLVLLSISSIFAMLLILPAVIGGFLWRRSTSKASMISIVSGFCALLIALPFMPEKAFVPGFIVSGIVFIIASIMTKHDLDETIDLEFVKSKSSSADMMIERVH